ncbi:MAG: AMP-binding protein [Fibrobacter sp.]|nr:AMP-binding protein [Fibrobacter sp.]
MSNEFLDHFLDHVEKKANEVALGDGSRFYTWKEYGSLTGKVYAYLKDRGLGKEDIVGVRLGRGLSQLICEIGILRNGSAFVALDMDSVPEERSRYIEKNCGAKLLLGEKEWAEIQQYREEKGYNLDADENNLAFAVYTSGSTGKPKGALHERGSLSKCGHSVYHEKTSMIEGFDRFGVLIPQSMAAALIFTLKSTFVGAAVFIPPLSTVKDPNALLLFLEKFQISNAFAPPVLVPMIDSAKSLRLILVGGELCIHSYSEKKPLYQIYAASESMFVLNTTPIRKEDPLPTLEVPGSENKVQIVDGELCFYNPYFRGYAGDPVSTKSVFLETENISVADKIYRSRDGAKWDSQGRLVVTGRLDDMFKVNGNRVEPGEVESAFKKISGASEAAMRKFDIGNRSVTVLFYTHPKILCGSVRDWKEILSAELPHYMIPNFFLEVESFPHLENGKLNRRGLSCPDFSKLRPEYVPPQTELQRLIANALEESLEVEHIGLDDDFFLLGGDSIAAMEMLLALERFGLKLQDIDAGKTVRGIAEILEARQMSFTAEISTDTIDPFPLLLPQKHMLLQQLENAGASPLWLNLQLELPSDVNVENFSRAVDTAIVTHPAFLFTFEKSEELVQHYHPELFTPTPIQKIQGDIEAELAAFFRPTPVLNSLLYRACILQSGGKNIFAMTVNHAMIDGSSLSLFLFDVQRIYNNQEPAKDKYIKALIEFENYIRSRQGKRALQAAEKRQAKILSSYDTIPKPDFEGSWGAAAKTAERDVAILRYYPTELYAFAYAKTVHESNHTDKIAFVVTHHGKVTEAQISSCGNFATDILIALDFKGKTDQQLLSSIQKQIADALRVPFRPVLPAMTAVIYQSNVLEMKLFGKNAVESYVSADFDVAENALNVHIFKSGKKMKLMCEYDSARFKLESMESFAARLEENIQKLFRQQDSILHQLEKS